MASEEASGRITKPERYGIRLKVIKRIFYFICILMVAGCAAVLLFALNPSMTQSLAAALYGGEDREEVSGQEGMDGETLPITETGENNGAAAGDSTEFSGNFPNTQGSESSGLQGENTAYVVPENEVVTLPEQVSGRSGYEPIKEEGKQVEDTEADSLKAALQTGNTGEDLSFDTEIYPYYGMLEPGMQRIYRQIYANAMELGTSFAPVTTVNVNQLKNVFEAVYNDHPELFWLETGYSCKYTRAGQCVEITLQYNPVANKLEAAKTEMETQAARILNGAGGLSDDYEKEKYVHDALISMVDYDTGASMNQSAYSALVNGKSVCAGYARAFQYLMQKLGIPCYYCTGYSGEDHAWNIVKLSDGFYNVDTTWDDTDPATYDYFNKSDQEYAGTHVRKDMSVYLPACGGGSYGGRESGSPAGVALPDAESVQLTETVEPLTWADENSDLGSSAAAALKRAGVSESEVIKTLEDYYEDCRIQMEKAGTGNQQFINVVPEALWNTIEQEYGEGKYEKGYVEEALKTLKMENFAIQLQAQSLGAGYYRLYHNIVTW